MAISFINQVIFPLKMTNEAQLALVYIEEFRCSFFPVVNQRQFVGFITKDIIQAKNNIEKTIEQLDLVGKNCVVGPNVELKEIIRMADIHELPIVGVVDEAGHYLGIVPIPEIRTLIYPSTTYLVGSLLVLSMDFINYSLTEISRHVEENNVKVISAILLEDPFDKTKVKLVLKINQADLSRIVITFERFGYRIIGCFQEIMLEDENKERLDLVMKYLNI